MIKDVMLIVIAALGLSIVSEVKAEEDWAKLYLSEERKYIIAYGKPFPERTAFECKNGDLWRWGYIIRDYQGKPIECTIETMTRGEYEVRDNISRVF